MFSFIKGLPTAPRIAAIAGLLLLAALAVTIANHFIDRAFDSAETAGATKGAAQAAEKGLSNVEAANRAADAVARDDRVRDAECMRNARNPENC